MKNKKSFEDLINTIRKHNIIETSLRHYVAFWEFDNAECEALIKSYVRTHAGEFWGVKDN